MYVTTTPNRVGAVHNILQEELHRHSRIHINIGKTQVWNAAGIRPPACDELERIAQLTDPDARVWKGFLLPTSEQGVRILGTPVGHPDFVQAFLRKVLEEHDVLLSRIPMVEDLQSAWALLLHCAGGRANFMLRVVRPEAVQTFAEGHSDGLWSCLRNILGVTRHKSNGSGHCHDASISWRDGSPQRCSHESCGILGKLGRLPFNGPRTTPKIATTILRRVETLWLLQHWWQHERLQANWPPSWEALADGQRPPLREPGDFRHGWQHEASSRVRQHREILLPQLTDSERAMLRSQSGPLAGVPFSTTPSNFLSRIDSHFFRVLLLRRLRLPLPLSARQCRCGRPLDAFGRMCQSGGVGKAGLRSGECRCSDLP